jgi:hypothetical protein
MKIAPKSPEDDHGSEGRSRDAFTLESIRPVRDFTARKTLEQAHAFVEGLTQVFSDAESDESAQALVRELESVGITAAEAAEITNEALHVIELMADRDHKADVFHAAVREAGQGERAMYTRLASLARLLRLKLGPSAPALTRFGVPPTPQGEGKPKPPTPLFSAATSK